ncbi:hypothetical protein [Aequorivita marina]|uniref:hypothetical protein n=1 Tax=Aequorivita marina TaxID=3073654 RepID=UPI0028740893|nr:hypothetical protein [Aequorivita sp. S2608]MDS1297800.1 hypothetical protein [Aequorivita sp. S2608]
MKKLKQDTQDKTTKSSSNKEENPTYNPDLTKHDKDILKQKNIHGDGGDDQQLHDRKKKVDFTGKNLDVPGRQHAKKSKTGYRDEENQLFSQGGEDNENLEADNPRIEDTPSNTK